MFELGTVSPRASVQYSVFGGLVFIFFMMAISLLLLGSYARKEEVAGRVITRDVVRITHERAAHIQEVLVANGDQVSKNQPLIRVRTIEPENINNASLKTLSTETQERLASLLQDLADDEQHARSAQHVQKDLMQLQIDQLRKDVALNETIEQSIQRRVSIAFGQKQRHEKLAREGAISEVSLNEVIVRYETAIQDKANNQRALLSAQQRILELEQRISDADHALSTRMSEIARQRHELLERIQAFGKNQGYVLLSPVDGKVDAISIFAGGRAEAAYPMMLIRLNQPDPQPPTLMLDVSSSAIGFAAPGTEVIVRFDAFPYERYGVVKGRIIGSTASTYVDLPLGVVPSDQRQTPTYLVEVALDFTDPRIRIKEQWLKDGMTVRGSLRLEELSLIEWLFLPVIKGIERNPDFLHGLPSLSLQGAPST